MIFGGTGQVARNFYVTGFPWSPTYLLDHEKPILFEAGFFCMAPLYVKDIVRVIGEKVPSFLFLTHVHYDHCGATAYFKKVFQGLKVCTSKRAREILSRPNAIALMTSLSQSVIPLIASLGEIDGDELLRSPFEAFPVDIVFENGEFLDIGPDLHVQVIVTPGHTRDMLSYYIPERKILIATESAGCRGQTGRIVSEFLVDFDAYIASLKRLSALDVDIFCQGHHFVFTGEDVGRFFEDSLREAFRFRTRVLELLCLEGKDTEKVVEIIKKEEYDPNPGPKQPEGAYLLNLKTRVKHLAEKREELNK